ncbi:MAG TPA: TIGR03086 family metal-binding protein [Streptosporangiaceae bacterium]|nr:TIGR03086 family metal-binding protein [Streptosporangiaceae bacterium]
MPAQQLPARPAPPESVAAGPVPAWPASPATGPLARACASTRAVLARVRPAQLGAATPCASWDVRALISHFVAGPGWAAAAVATGDGTPAAGRDYAAGDYLASYDAAVQAAVDAFGAPGALERAVRLPFGEFPGAFVLGIVVQDRFVHGWDLARATGQPADLDPGLADDLLASARAVVTDAFRGPEGTALFGPARQPGPGAGAAGRLAAFLGRAA